MPLPLRKLIDLAPRKPPVSAICPFTPKDLRGLLPGLPEGAVTEISGARSSGRTTLLQASLAAATGLGELCAVVDGSDAFDPASAQAGPATSSARPHNSQCFNTVRRRCGSARGATAVVRAVAGIRNHVVVAARPTLRGQEDFGFTLTPCTDHQRRSIFLGIEVDRRPMQWALV